MHYSGLWDLPSDQVIRVRFGIRQIGHQYKISAMAQPCMHSAIACSIYNIENGSVRSTVYHAIAYSHLGWLTLPSRKSE